MKQGLQRPRPATGLGKCPGSVPRGVSGALQTPGSGVSKKYPESVPGVSKRCPGHSGDTLGTLFGHCGGRGPKGPRDTPRDTPGTLRARRARETPVAGREARRGMEGHREFGSLFVSKVKIPLTCCRLPSGLRPEIGQKWPKNGSWPHRGNGQKNGRNNGKMAAKCHFSAIFGRFFPFFGHFFSQFPGEAISHFSAFFP